MGSSIDPKKQEAIKFAKRIADHLESGRTAGSFAKLYVIAPPAFLGQLRDHLSTSLERMVHDTIDKNLVTQDEKTIRAQLPDHL